MVWLSLLVAAYAVDANGAIVLDGPQQQVSISRAGVPAATVTRHQQEPMAVGLQPGSYAVEWRQGGVAYEAHVKLAPGEVVLLSQVVPLSMREQSPLSVSTPVQAQRPKDPLGTLLMGTGGALVASGAAAWIAASSARSAVWDPATPPEEIRTYATKANLWTTVGVVGVVGGTGAGTVGLVHWSRR